MPLYSYRCKGCDHQFETLVMGADTPSCPSCGGGELERLLSVTNAPNDKIGEIKSLARRQAAREGHFSNYSRSETKGKL
ncbi:MAG TPA: zinc ribbon domain-containing protein [Candidatus Omnitrophota bacterium]|nr:zinc ribbon domain-containing protein [Candidatus Omnitrophota bacterium]